MMRKEMQYNIGPSILREIFEKVLKEFKRTNSAVINNLNGKFLKAFQFRKSIHDLDKSKRFRKICYNTYSQKKKKRIRRNLRYIEQLFSQRMLLRYSRR